MNYREQKKGSLGRISVRSYIHVAAPISALPKLNFCSSACFLNSIHRSCSLCVHCTVYGTLHRLRFRQAKNDGTVFCIIGK